MHRKRHKKRVLYGGKERRAGSAERERKRLSLYQHKFYRGRDQEAAVKPQENGEADVINGGAGGCFWRGRLPVLPDP